MFLLRADVDRVMSVDPRVWPPEREATGFGASWSDQCPVQDLMLDYAAAEALFERAVGKGASASVLVGFSVSLPPEGLFAVFGLSPAQPPPANVDLRLLGYDIATGAFLSGLSNCGYEPGELTEWGRRLSSDHLLESASEADVFRELTDRRVPEHAPFYAIGVWLVRES